MVHPDEPAVQRMGADVDAREREDTVERQVHLHWIGVDLEVHMVDTGGDHRSSYTRCWAVPPDERGSSGRGRDHEPWHRRARVSRGRVMSVWISACVRAVR